MSATTSPRHVKIMCDVLTAGNGLVAYRRLLREDVRSMKRQLLSDHGALMVGIAKQYLLTPDLSQQQIFLAQLCGLCEKRSVNAYIGAAHDIVGVKVSSGSMTRSASNSGLTTTKPRLLLVNYRRWKNHRQIYVRHLCVTGKLPSRAHKVSRLTEKMCTDVLGWFESACFLGFAPGKVNERWVEGKQRLFSVMYRASGECEYWKCFKAFKDTVLREGGPKEKKMWLPGEGTFKTFCRLP